MLDGDAAVAAFANAAERGRGERADRAGLSESDHDAAGAAETVEQPSVRLDDGLDDAGGDQVLLAVEAADAGESAVGIPILAAQARVDRYDL